jgi:hypothetical protein
MFRCHRRDARAQRFVRIAMVYKDFAEAGRHSVVGLGITGLGIVKTLRHDGFSAELWGCRTPQDLKERLRQSKQVAEQPTWVIISAPWIPTSEIASMAKEYRDTHFVVVCHSAIGFLAADTDGIRLMREAVDLQHSMPNFRVAGNSKKFVDWASVAWGIDVAWLPNLYFLHEVEPGHRPPWRGDHLRLGLYGAWRPYKNGLTSVAVAVELAMRLRIPTELYISSGRDEGGNSCAVEELTRNVPNFKLVHAGWREWAEFRRRLVGGTHLNLQLSYTESFNMVTADSAFMGVPCLVSDAITWVPKAWQAKADDPCEATRAALRLLRSRRAPHDGRRALERHVASALRQWRKFLLSAANYTG